MMAIPLLLLALLCCAMGCTATEFPEFRCMYDVVMKNSGAMPARIAEPGPDKSGVQGAAKTASNAVWEPIRIEVFSEDLNSDSQYCTAVDQKRPTFEEPSQTASCTAMDILTDKKKNQLLNDMIPSALKLHSDRLLVQRVTGSIIVPKYTDGTCSVFTIPQTHHTTGVVDADIVMYAAAGPTGSEKAGADLCSFAPNGRPVVGVMNIGPAMISSRDQSIRVVAHEIAHALGFAYDIMNKLNMVRNVSNIRGRSRLVVSSDVTLRKTRAHYNCDSIAGMELENEGDIGTANSHWERRNARDELMAGFSGVGYYTALTMAAFEDQKYYRANWGMEETMDWGRNAGCPFLDEKCVNNGKTKYPDMFCTEVISAYVCTFARKGLGKCTLGNFKTPLPVEFQYFANPKLGGAGKFLDYCPIVYQYSNTGCTDGDLYYMPGSRVGPNSLCLKGEGLRVERRSANAVQDICAEVSCEDNTVRVRYAGTDTWHPCPEGSTITPGGSFTAGKIVCPRHAEICSTNLHPGDNGMNKKIDNKFDTQTTTAIPSRDNDSLSKGHDSAYDGKGDASSTDSNVDSSHYLNQLYRSFIHLCVSALHISILMVI